MPGIKANCRGDRHEGRGGAFRKRDLDSKLLSAFPASCCSRMFIGLHMAARWEKKASIHIVNQKDIEVVAIQHYEVGHEVALRQSWL